MWLMTPDQYDQVVYPIGGWVFIPLPRLSKFKFLQTARKGGNLHMRK